MVEKNMITNCDINADDINRAAIIWGTTEYVIKGKTKRKKPNTHNKIPNMTLPISVLQQHQKTPCPLTFFMLIESLFSYQKQEH